jgi:hypothetical protein
VDALDPEAIQGGQERGTAVAVNQSPANGSPAASEQDAAEEAHLRSHQTRFTAEAAHSCEDRQLGCNFAGVHRSGHLVSHSGNSGAGEFAHTWNVTGIQTAWTESRAVLGRGQAGVERAFNEVEKALPFRLLGLDSDNGSEFINWHLKAWRERKQIQLTRGRP